MHMCTYTGAYVHMFMYMHIRVYICIPRQVHLYWKIVELILNLGFYKMIQNGINCSGGLTLNLCHAAGRNCTTHSFHELSDVIGLQVLSLIPHQSLRIEGLGFNVLLLMSPGDS